MPDVVVLVELLLDDELVLGVMDDVDDVSPDEVDDTTGTATTVATLSGLAPLPPPHAASSRRGITPGSHLRVNRMDVFTVLVNM